MARRTIPHDHKWFHFYDANPKGHITNDCSVRAISLATEKTWNETFSSLCEIAMKEKLMPNDDKTVEKYLKSLGWTKNKTLYRPGSKERYPVSEFCHRYAEKDKVYIIRVCKHWVTIKNCKAWDTWDSTKLSAGIYWTEDL